ncbi:MAG: TolC family outer membrane protein [Chlorobiaceae bacterium]
MSTTNTTRPANSAALEWVAKLFKVLLTKLKPISAVMIMLCIWAPQIAVADLVTVRDAVEKALNTNPEIKIRFHAFRDVYNEGAVAKGGFLPKVNVSAGAGRDWLRSDYPGNQDYWQRSVKLELSQMLFDGFYTRSQVGQLKNSAQARYFEFMDAVQNIGLESFKAYTDVLRCREMVCLSKRNYDYHLKISDQITRRVHAGVGAGVDMDQITARVALAKSNYMTELSNLHEVCDRYQRYVGDLPEENMQEVLLPDDGIPGNVGDAIKEAYQYNAGFLSTMSDIKSAKYAVKMQESKFYPRLDFKASNSISWDPYADIGIYGRQNLGVVELALTYNIFNGGSDAASLHQYREKMYRAIDSKDKAATDLRQLVSTAFNDKQTITQQMKYFDQHRKSLESVRLGYQDQFNIGKRSLLDLLDTENEYYQAQRAYFTGFFDLKIANARTLAGMGKLLSTIGVVRAEMPSLKDLGIPMPGVTESDVPSSVVTPPVTSNELEKE